MRVSLHCQGCAGKVKKHLSKMEGTLSYLKFPYHTISYLPCIFIFCPDLYTIYNGNNFLPYFLCLMHESLGVTSFSIDLESKRVTVRGHISPNGVLESLSKVKRAELWPCSEMVTKKYKVDK